MARENLSEELRHLRDAEGVSFAAVAAQTGVSRSTISLVANQGYKLKPSQEEKVWEFIEELRGATERVKEEPPAPLPTAYKTRVELYETREFREAMGWCAYVFNKRKMGVLVGHPGSGKTTTCAKLTKLYQSQGKKVGVVAADTFRAGAIEQLARWADKLGVPCIKGRENGDPSSVLVDGCRYAKEHNLDILLCDTAGRLQNKVNLMNELAKMRKVIGREIEGAPHHVWLVLDSTTGQNGLSQAKIFQEVTDVTGIILTKMDGTAKGGIVLAIKDVLHIPVYYLGLGEREDDLKPFDLDLYLYSISEGIRDVG